jgi:hypothetical protein
LLIAVKLIATPLGSNDRNSAFSLKEGPATVVNEVAIFSLICAHCDFFAAHPLQPPGFTRAAVRRNNG